MDGWMDGWMDGSMEDEIMEGGKDDIITERHYSAPHYSILGKEFQHICFKNTPLGIHVHAVESRGRRDQITGDRSFRHIHVVSCLLHCEDICGREVRGREGGEEEKEEDEMMFERPRT